MNVTKTRFIHAATLLLSLMIIPLLSACSGTSARVFFVEPTDGSTVSSPVQVKMGAENFTIEPSGEVREGAGHLHITVNDGCSPVGEIIPADDTHIHYGKGQTETQLELAPGEYNLCLQAADGIHAVLDGDGMTQQITITVE